MKLDRLSQVCLVQVWERHGGYPAVMSGWERSEELYGHTVLFSGSAHWLVTHRCPLPLHGVVYPGTLLVNSSWLRCFRETQMVEMRVCRQVHSRLRDLGKSAQWPVGITSTLPLGRKEEGGLLSLLCGWSRGILTSFLWTLCRPSTAQI